MQYGYRVTRSTSTQGVAIGYGVSPPPAKLESTTQFMSIMAERSLEDTFREFCAFGGNPQQSPQMDGAKFAKLCRDMKLLDKKLTPTDVDIIFAKSKP